MSGKEAIIMEKKRAIELLQRELDGISKVELRRLYKTAEEDWDGSALKVRTFESWGYPETFNKESIRFCIVASDNPRYGRSNRWRKRKNISAFNYDYLVDKLTRAKKDDIPLLIGLPYKFPELEYDKSPSPEIWVDKKPEV